MLTGEEMCQTILKAFPDVAEKPENIWNSNQFGELSDVFFLYLEAKAKLTGKQMQVDSLGDITWI